MEVWYSHVVLGKDEPLSLPLLQVQLAQLEF